MPLRVCAADHLAAAGTVVISSALQRGLQQIRPELDRHSSAALLRQTARFDPDPSRRRIARLVLANQGDVSAARRQWLLRAQGWGESPLTLWCSSNKRWRREPWANRSSPIAAGKSCCNASQLQPPARTPSITWASRAENSTNNCYGALPPTPLLWPLPWTGTANGKTPAPDCIWPLGGALARSRYGTPTRVR